MFDKTQDQTGESQQEQNSAQPQNPQNFEKRMENLNSNGKKQGKRKKIYSIIGIILILIFTGSAVAGSYYFWDDVVNFFTQEKEPNLVNNNNNNIDCAMDVRECPDGSFVSRIPPDCEFEECPAVKIEKDCAKDGGLINFPSGTNENLPDVCCDGLKGLAGFGINENGECEQLLGGPFLACMPCGNGICESINNFNENKCNCPEDCDELKILDISDWQTYRNEEFGFKVKYPEKEIKISINDNVYPVGLRIVFPSNLFSVIIDTSYKKSILDYKYIDVISQKTTRNGFQIYSLKDSSVPFIAFAKKFDDKIYIIEFQGNIELNFMEEQMLSTFKFFKDTDSDGLFDDKEAEYNCDINNPDTDGDGFLDGDEVKNGYNPNGDGKL